MVAKCKNRLNKTITHLCSSSVFIGTLLNLMLNSSIAGELNIDAGITAELISQQIKTKDLPKRTIDVENMVVRPFASLSYQARDFDLFFKGTNNQIRRNLDSETVSQNYTEYSYSGNYAMVQNVLSFSASGIRGFRNNSFNSYLVDDFLLNSDSLNKVTSDSANLQLNIRRGEFYGLSATTSYRSTSSELNNSRISNDSVFENDSYGLSVNAISGEGLDGVQVSIAGSVQYLKRNSGQDFVSQQLSISGDFKVYGDFGLSLNGSYENNEVRTDLQLENSGLREFYSVGAGLIWQPRNDKYVKVLLNRSRTPSLVDGEEDEEDTFLSYNVNWSFSERTTMQGSFTRRFFGDAGNLSFRHQLKNWRSSLSYTEIVSSTSQLLNTSDVGLFICENGSTNIADCRLSDTLEPELEAGESLQPLVVQSLGLSDRIILRKSLSARTAVTRRRTTLSLTASRSETDEVEIDRVVDVSAISASVDFSLSHNTKIQYRYTHAKTELDQIGEFENATTKKQSIELRRKLTRRFTTSLSLSYLDRDGEITRGTPTLIGLNGPLTDRRITFSISYDLGRRD